MMTLRTFLTLCSAGLVLGFTGARAQAADPVSVLIVTGQNNHDWSSSSPLIRDLLQESGRFKVSMTISPEKDAPKEAWAAWRPNFKDHQAILCDYNGQMWPDEVKTAFVDYVRQGGRVVIVHAANNAFTGWKEYEEMCGLLWRNKDYADRLYFDEAGKLVRVPKGEGPGAGHGKQHDYQITTRDEEHPIFKDLPKVWLHVSDELYHGQHGPAENMRILASAFSATESGGTGVHEPMVWWIPFGKGKVISLMPGHFGKGQKSPTPYDCIGFRTILQRSTEWVATDKVSLPLPANFPTADQLGVLSK